jgi:hypothetical protein
LVLIDGLLLAMIFALGNSVIAFFQSPAFDLRLAQVVFIILIIIAFEALSYHLYLKRLYSKSINYHNLMQNSK